MNYNCAVCGEAFNGKNEKDNHHRLQHQQTAEINFENGDGIRITKKFQRDVTGKFNCRYCPYGSDRASNLKRHMDKCVIIGGK